MSENSDLYKLLYAQLDSAFADLNERLHYFSQQMSSIGAVFQNTEERNHELIESFCSKIRYFSDKYKVIYELKYRPLLDCGLFIAPSMTADIIMAVVEKYESGDKNSIPAIVEGFYSKNNHNTLKNVVSSWESLDFYSTRIQIFRDALDAHISGKWTLSIPALLPHIEGISGEVLQSHGISIKAKDKRERQKDQNSTGRLFNQFPIPEDFSLEYVLVSSFLNYLGTFLYIPIEFDDPEIRNISGLNRHGVLHGYQTNYATRLNSIRCFLALDSLTWLVDNGGSR